METNDDRVGVGMIVGGGLLGAVAGRLCVGSFDDLRKRSHDANFGDIGARFRRRKMVLIRLQRGLRGCVVMLAEEIGFSHRFVRKGSLIGESGRQNKQRGRNGEKGASRVHLKCPTDWMLSSVSRLHG